MAIRVEKFVVTNAKESALENEVNFYLIWNEGDKDEAVLIDSGFPTLETYKILKSIKEKWNVKAAVITHLHEDHAGGIQLLNELGVRVFVHKREVVPPSFKIDIDSMVYRVVDGLRLFFKGFTLRLIYTPGHTRGHISPYVEENKMLFSGDLILGRGTPWVGPPEGDMYVYMKTLNSLLNLDISIIYPGHGPEITEPLDKIKEYITHRKTRDRQILEAIGNGFKSVDKITEYVYGRENIPEHIIPFARLTVLSHLEKLEKEGKVFLLVNNEYELR